MESRKLTITINQDWQGRLRDAAHTAFAASGYVGDYLNFQSPAAFFGRLTERRWVLVNALQDAGPVGVRELARHVGRDVKRVHEDIAVLTELGLVEREENGAVVCPFADIHVDMHLLAAA